MSEILQFIKTNRNKPIRMTNGRYFIQSTARKLKYEYSSKNTKLFMERKQSKKGEVARE
jgi:hypothetical protein